MAEMNASGKKKRPHKPSLKDPSKASSHALVMQIFALGMVFAAFLSVSMASLVVTLHNTGLVNRSAVLGILLIFMVMALPASIIASYWMFPHLPVPFARKRYRRDHTAHLRLDRLARAVRCDLEARRHHTSWLSQLYTRITQCLLLSLSFIRRLSFCLRAGPRYSSPLSGSPFAFFEASVPPQTDFYCIFEDLLNVFSMRNSVPDQDYLHFCWTCQLHNEGRFFSSDNALYSILALHPTDSAVDLKDNMYFSDVDFDDDHNGVPDLCSITESDSSESSAWDSDSDEEWPAFKAVRTDFDCTHSLPHEDAEATSRCLSPCMTSRTLSGGGGTAASPAIGTLNDVPAAPALDDVFREDSWIGVGLRWDDKFPEHVKAARNSARIVPQTVRTAVIPARNMSVQDVLLWQMQNVPVPEPSSNGQYFSTDPPTVLIESQLAPTDIDVGIVLSLASHSDTLRLPFNDNWISGAKSIVHPLYPRRRYPLWMENLVFEVSIAQEKIRRWQNASDWIRIVSQSHISSDDALKLADACFERFRDVSWVGYVPNLKRTSVLTCQDLSIFLSDGIDGWLNDEMINAGGHFVSRELHGTLSGTRIASCFAFGAIRNRYMDESIDYNPGTYRREVDRWVKSEDVDEIWFPLNVNNNHWTLIKLHLELARITYSDSMHSNASPPAADVQLIRWWYKSLRPDGPVVSVGESDFHLPQQRDTSSCGVVVLSTLASELLHYPPWTAANASLERMLWFLRLSNDFLTHDSDADQDDNSNGGNGSNGGDDDNGFWGTSQLDDIASDPGAMSSVATPAPSSSCPSSPSLGSMACSVTDEPSFPHDEMAEVPDMPLDSMVVDESESNSLWSHVSEDDVSAYTDSAIESAPESSDPEPPLYCRRRRSQPLAEFDSTDSDDSDSPEARAILIHRKRKAKAGAKPKTSYERQKATRDRARAEGADFDAHPKRLRTFREKILKDDKHAEFDDGDVRKVRCSACGEWLMMRMLYEVKRWKEHRSTPKCKQNQSRGLKSQSLLSFGVVRSKETPPTQAVTYRQYPCPGLRQETDVKINTYLHRSTAVGGGAPSRRRIARALFPELKDVSRKRLNDGQYRMVLQREQAQFRWINRHGLGAVFSSDCEVDVETADGKTPQPCTACLALRGLHTFQSALNRKVPDEDKMKYTPAVWRPKELSAIYLRIKGVYDLVEKNTNQSTWLKFATGVVEGKYKQHEVLLGMVEAMVKKTERMEKGKALTNMSYSRGFADFCNILGTISPRAYQTFRQHFGGLAMRSIRRIRARAPRFKAGISEENIQMAADILAKYSYKGPLAFSWDDTDLEKALSTYEEYKKGKVEAYLILGAVGDPICVSREDEIDEVFQDVDLQKAEKLRLYVLTLPMPKIPPIIVAAVARGSSDNADSLFHMHKRIVALLDAHKIYPVSYAADGTEVERSLQRLINNSADEVLDWSVESSIAGCTVKLKLRLRHGAPFVTVQDSKHAKKTARNQLHTGARILVLGSYPAFYAQLRRLAFDSRGPLFHRDVEKVDRQDDRAAARVFSAEALRFNLDEFPEHKALSVYLFVIGELIDAWQNRRISHLLRAKMVLRARYFIVAWWTHITSHPSYSVNTQFISRESYDIFISLCDSLLLLIMIYRRYYPLYPLLPWLHSTEANEHIFGVMRQIKPDFTYADLLYLQPKLRTLLLGAFGGLSPQEQANQTAAGYHHTYFNADDLDLETLMSYPTDQAIFDISTDAFKEAEQLLVMLGINAGQMLARYKESPSWPSVSKPQQSTVPRPPRTLFDLLRLYDGVKKFPSSKEEDNFVNCQMALAAESVDSSLAIDDVPEEDTAKLDVLVQDQLKKSSPNEPSTVTPPSMLKLVTSTGSLNTDVLVAERLDHQPKFVAKAVRKGRNVSQQTSSTADDSSLRELLLVKLSHHVPESEMFNTTTGIDRQVRHTGTFVMRDDCTGQGTRAQNKEKLLSLAAQNHTKNRDAAFQSLKHIHDNLHLANITAYSPLAPSHHVVVLADTGSASPFKKESRARRLLLGKVITLYSKPDYVNSKYEWVESAQNVGRLSHICVQVYAPLSGKVFTSTVVQKPEGSTILRVPISHVIFSLSSFFRGISHQDVSTSPPMSLLTLDDAVMKIFEQFSDRLAIVHAAVDNLSAAIKTNKKDKKVDNSSSLNSGLIGEDPGEEDCEEVDSD